MSVVLLYPQIHTRLHLAVLLTLRAAGAAGIPTSSNFWWKILKRQLLLNLLYEVTFENFHQSSLPQRPPTSLLRAIQESPVTPAHTLGSLCGWRG
jgi:hypothetical protein